MAVKCPETLDVQMHVIPCLQSLQSLHDNAKPDNSKSIFRANSDKSCWPMGTRVRRQQDAHYNNAQWRTPASNNVLSQSSTFEANLEGVSAGNLNKGSQARKGKGSNHKKMKLKRSKRNPK